MPTSPLAVADPLAAMSSPSDSESPSTPPLPPPLDLGAMRDALDAATAPKTPTTPTVAATASMVASGQRRRSIVSVVSGPGVVTPLLPGVSTPPIPSLPASAVADAIAHATSPAHPLRFSGGTLPRGDDADSHDIAEELEHHLEAYAHDDEIKHQLQLSFFRAAAAGDARKANYLLKHCRGDILLDGRDETGATALMQAACFGHLNLVRILVEASAVLDVQDNNGWTALMWATNNNREEVVEFLLDQGGDASVKSRAGRTVQDFIERAHLPQREKLASIFYSDTRSVMTRRSSGSDDGSVYAATVLTGITSLTSESYYVPSLYGVDYREMCDIVGTTVPAQLAHIREGDSALPPVPLIDPQVFLNEEEEGLIDFSWDRCPPDQMFVFTEQSLDHLLHVAIRRLSDPLVIRSQNNNPAGFTRRPVSANVIFLAARYAGYYSSQVLLDKLFGGALDMLEQVLRPKRHDMMFLGYWLANCSRLLYFLKKDSGLVIATLAHQVRLSELIQDIFMALLRDAQGRIASIVDDALLNHDTIPGYSTIKFRERKLPTRGAPSPPPPAEEGLAGMFGLRRALSSAGVTAGSLGVGGVGSVSSTGSTTPPKLSNINRLSSYFSSSGALNVGGGSRGGPGGSGGPGKRHGRHGKRTPRTVTTVLSSTLYVLQTFQIHPSLVHQAIEQLFYYVGTSTFNRLLSRPELCCRWKAMQIRMNLSHLEEWVRSNAIPAPSKDSFTRHLQPVISLLQLLQIVSHFDTLSAFREAIRESEHLNILSWSQLLRAVDLYTYEEDEKEMSNEIREYIARCAERATEADLAIARGVSRDGGDDDFDDYDMVGVSRRGSEIVDLSIMADMHTSNGSGTSTSHLPDPLASPPLSPPPLDDNGVPMFHLPPSESTRQRQRQRSYSTSGPSGMTRGPMVTMQATDSTLGRPYTYLMLDDKYWMPFAVPTNVGERVILRFVDGDESYIEEAPVLTPEIVDMLDNKI
ncbi:hypothetical protein BC828DRAFT_385372 [Blastocladiella britannica]|nr:hypothetical protein BC828DRAFT_385372 [Blastocladiella britannica]